MEQYYEVVYRGDAERAAVTPMPRAPLYSKRADEILSRAAITHPHTLYAQLREHTPIARIGDSGFHTVATWPHIEEVLGREDDFSANLTGVLYLGDSGEPACFELPQSGSATVIATADDPRHAVHRTLLQPAFLAAQIKAMEPLLRSWASATLAPLTSEGGGDFTALAEQVPARAVAHLLGLPQEDMPLHRQWAMMGGDILAGKITSERLIYLAEQTTQMATYLAAQLDAVPNHIDAGAHSPILYSLAKAIAQETISREEAVGIAIVLFGAGGESTSALIGSALYRLAGNTELAEQLRRKPALIPLFIEEVIRLEPPFNFHYRTVRRACTLGGFDLVPGDRLMLLWAAANRDGARFVDPDTLRLDRRHSRQHLSFGRGMHFCIGAGLARLEAKIIVETVLTDPRRLELMTTPKPVYADSIFVRRFEQLPLRFAD
ncbi:cytochrome P450 [Halioglobus japonicus]|uniref:cytochrome P450 n=1 Tax=Halioglobus japonicus TaxID=930805 RepID=UPI0011AF8E1E|nr:cytochrome P450 [Halioglobus japonicus]